MRRPTHALAASELPRSRTAAEQRTLHLGFQRTTSWGAVINRDIVGQVHAAWRVSQAAISGVQADSAGPRPIWMPHSSRHRVTHHMEARVLRDAKTWSTTALRVNYPCPTLRLRRGMGYAPQLSRTPISATSSDGPPCRYHLGAQDDLSTDSPLFDSRSSDLVITGDTVSRETRSRTLDHAAYGQDYRKSGKACVTSLVGVRRSGHGKFRNTDESPGGCMIFMRTIYTQRPPMEFASVRGTLHPESTGAAAVGRFQSAFGVATGRLQVLSRAAEDR